MKQVGLSLYDQIQQLSSKTHNIEKARLNHNHAYIPYYLAQSQAKKQKKLEQATVTSVNVLQTEPDKSSHNNIHQLILKQILKNPELYYSPDQQGTHFQSSPLMRHPNTVTNSNSGQNQTHLFNNQTIKNKMRHTIQIQPRPLKTDSGYDESSQEYYNATQLEALRNSDIMSEHRSSQILVKSLASSSNMKLIRMAKHKTQILQQEKQRVQQDHMHHLKQSIQNLTHYFNSAINSTKRIHENILHKKMNQRMNAQNQSKSTQALNKIKMQLEFLNKIGQADSSAELNFRPQPILFNNIFLQKHQAMQSLQHLKTEPSQGEPARCRQLPKTLNMRFQKRNNDGIQQAQSRIEKKLFSRQRDPPKQSGAQLKALSRQAPQSHLINEKRTPIDRYSSPLSESPAFKQEVLAGFSSLDLPISPISKETMKPRVKVYSRVKQNNTQPSLQTQLELE